MAVVDSLKIKVFLDGKKAEAWMKRFQKSMFGINKIAKANNNIFKDFLKLAGVAGFTKLSMDAMNLGHSLEILSKRSGVSASNLSGMRNALSAAGGKAEMFDALVKNMSHDLAKWQFGDSKFFQELNKWGVSALGNNGELRDTVSIMFDLADAAQNMANNFGDLAAIAKLEDLGIPAEFAQEMIKGRSHFYNFYKENVRRTGALTDEESKKLDEVKKRFSELGTAISTALEKGVASLSYFDNAFKKTSEFVANNPMITSFATLAAGIPLATAAIKGLTGAVGVLGGVATTAFAPFFKLIAVGAAGSAVVESFVDWYFGDEPIFATSKADKERKMKEIEGEKYRKWINEGLSSGKITEEEAQKRYDALYKNFGIMKYSESERKAKKKEILSLYASGVIDPAQAVEMAEEYQLGDVISKYANKYANSGEGISSAFSWSDLADFYGVGSASNSDSHDFNLEQTNNITVETTGTNGEEIGNDIAERLGQITISTKPFFNSTGVR